MKETFIGSSDYIIRMLLVGVLSYLLLILIIRITGKRTLSKMNAFDLIITVALGSSLATVILDKSIALLEGMAALGLLILLQYVITFTSVRSKAVRKLIKSDPTLLYYHGLFIEKNMMQERISKDEIDQHVRNNGYSSYEEITAVVLESDGSLSVLDSDGDLLLQQKL